MIGLFAPRAVQELGDAVMWIAADNPAAARGLLDAAVRAAALVSKRPMLARARPELAPPRFRFWSLRGYPYLLVVDVEHEPPVVARVVHQARDLPMVLDDF